MNRKDGSDLSSRVAQDWAELRASKDREWESRGMCDDYYIRVHTSCGTEIMVLGGFVPTCPKCQPEEWAERCGKK